MTALRRTRLATIGVLVGLAAIPLGGVAAFAHDSLVQSDPAPDATVKTLTKIDLTFSADPIDRDGADIIQVKGPDGKYYETGCPTLADSVMSTPVKAGPAGTYEVLWRVVSSDGHPIANTYSFTYDPGGAVDAAAGSTEPKCGPAAAATQDASVATVPSSPQTGLWIGLGVGAAVVVVVAVAAVLLIRRPRAEGSPEDEAGGGE